MFEADQICPYTGLRAFTEEESLYFKGREDDIDQATEQLQRNKFLMLTGASGDGKSSLIYAGIIPNARAGFLKSKYTQWCVADFRPERTPFQNLCKSIASQLDITNTYTVQAELTHGFSAIIDLYKNSKRNLDTNSMAWQLADDAGKAALKREAANLIILVDQFEEFFTNPENYHKGVPSVDANLVLNLLLETARIALEEDLPVYIVFTMRSDYIGQCAAFRGLPEYIGFSQFFVPRLNRTQLQQVIEEPATLSGNLITRRLTERLIHDLTEGVDQLPIVQHALNQIWHAADNGKEEMDLIHYAMVGGMSMNELPDEQVDRFNKWFVGLPDHIKAFYHEPNLQNVLDTHTNKLYEQASDYYQQKTGKPISDEDAKAIIKTAFICLTKIDQSRAVRNRMTLKEITNIIGRPEIGTKDVGTVLNIFREPGNTFIRPFILEDHGSQALSENDVLDITHESLIRNWEYLEQWAKEEFENYSISLDFEQQLNRWVESGKSNDFLLPIGPLTYFENWFNTAKPNTHWIARYLPEEVDEEKKLSNAKQVLRNSQEFLKRSAGKHRITRTIIRYGPKRIAMVLGMVAIIAFSSFAIRNYFLRQNVSVLKNIKSQTIELANIPKLSPEFPIPAITEQLILGNLTIEEVLEGISDLRQKIKIGTGIATQLVTQGRYEPQKEILQSLKITDSLMEKLPITGSGAELSHGLKLINDYKVTAGFASYFNRDQKLISLATSNAKRSAHRVMQILKEQPQDFTDIQFLSLALDDGINNKIFSQGEISQLLKILSPFEDGLKTPWLEKNYYRDNLLMRGGRSYGQKFNGLYQDLAYLYAAEGRPERVLQCMDTILRYQENFYQNDYTTHIENASNIAAVFYVYGSTDQLESFIQGYCKRKSITSAEFYSKLVSRALMDIETYKNVNFFNRDQQFFSNLNIKFSNDQMLTFFFTKLKEEISKIKDSNERNLSLAVMLKNEGVLFAYRRDMSGRAESGTDQLFRDALKSYQFVSKEYLEQPVAIEGSSIGAISITMPRKFLFLYPDYRVPFHPFEPRGRNSCFQSYAFINYVLDHDLFDKLYQTPDELKYFGLWLLEYQQAMFSRDLYLHDQMPDSFLERLATKLEARKADQSTDLNILYIHLCNNAFEKKNPDKALGYFHRIQTDKLRNLFIYNDFFLNNCSFEMLGRLISELTVNNHFDNAYTLINMFKKEVNRSSLYGFASQMISLHQQSPETAQRLVDSARLEMKKLDKSEIFQPNRHDVAIALMWLNPEKNSKEAYGTIKNSFDKFAAIQRFIKAYAFHDNLYAAQQQAPPLISNADKGIFLRETIKGFNLTKTPKNEWNKFRENERAFFRRGYLIYVNEN